MRIIIGVVLLNIVYIRAASTYYEGNKIYLVTPQNIDQLNALKSLEIPLNLDFWEELVRPEINRSYRIMVQPKYQLKFVGEMVLNRISCRVLIENVDEMISQEIIKNLQARKHGRNVDGLNFTYFWTYTDVTDYLHKISTDYKDIVEIEVLGNSFEANELLAVKISKAGKVDGTRPVVVVEGTIHAREWISTMICMHLISELVENSEQHDDFLNGIDWIIVPVVNADGFIYAHNTERLWRKTRSTIAGSTCLGVDPNRNFAYKWGVLFGPAPGPCDETWPGTDAESEPEVKLFSELIGRFNKTVLYLAVHSFGNYLLYPWSYDYIAIDNYLEHEEVGARVRSAIHAVNGNFYSLGNSAFTLYQAAGISIDYAAGYAKIPLAFTIELPGGGEHGFDIEPEKIESVIAETFPGLHQFALFLQERYVYNKI